MRYLASEWREKKKRDGRPPPAYNFSQASAKSMKSSALSTISVKECKGMKTIDGKSKVGNTSPQRKARIAA